jgi:hypothetical protein
MKADVTLEALAAEVQEKLGLHPESFSIFDGFGKVANSTALKRALSTATNGVCSLEVHETAAWQKMREMDAKIQMLIARCPVADSIMMSIEERSATRFAKLRSALEGLDTKVSCSIAPLMQSMALQQMDAKEQHGSLDASQSIQEIDARINGSIAPLMQSMALQQIEMKATLDSIHLDTLNANADQQITNNLIDTQKELAALRASYDEKVQEIDRNTKCVQQEMKTQEEDIQDVYARLKAVQMNVHCLAEQSDRDGELETPCSSAMQQDLGICRKTSWSGYAVDFSWPEGSGVSQIPATPYSKKSTYKSSQSGGGSAVSFARFNAPRQLDRAHGSRSLPLLSPVK